MRTKPLVFVEGGNESAKKRRSGQPAQSRKQSLPWLRCKHCGAKLAQVDVINGRPSLVVGRCGTIGNVTLVCPDCFTERVFYGQ